MDDCNADTKANALMVSLLAGKSFDIPDVDLSSPDFQLPPATDITDPDKIENSDLTESKVNGEGTFDVVMRGINSQLTEQFEKGRITGNEFAKSYVAAVEAALGNSVQFLLGKNQAYWQGVTAQIQSETAKVGLVTARVALETAKAQLASARFEALNQEAAYALVKMKLATEEVTYCTALFGLENLAPIQKVLLQEQVEAARAQTLDTRSDGAVVVGMLGKQKDLYTQQIISYQRDAEVKAAKLFTDAWITMKTIDEGLLPPAAFTNESLNKVLNTLKTNNVIGL